LNISLSFKTSKKISFLLRVIVLIEIVLFFCFLDSLKSENKKKQRIYYFVNEKELKISNHDVYYP
jgi:hypothetical protein